MRGEARVSGWEVREGYFGAGWLQNGQGNPKWEREAAQNGGGPDI